MYGWNASTLPSEPHIYFNSTASTIGFANTVSVPARSIQMHPGPNGVFAVLRWTAPSAGTYSVTGVFRGNDSAGGARIASIQKNGVEIFSAAVGGLGQLNAFNTSSTLSVGDALDFMLDPNGAHQNDSTGLTLVISNVNALPLTLGLVGYWNFNDCTANDISGLANSGTLVGSPTCVAGSSGSGMRFNSSNYAEIPDSASLDLTSAFTISTWFKADGLVPNFPLRLIYKTTAGTNNGYMFPVWSTGMALSAGPTGASATVPISSGVFHHAAVTFDQGTARFFLDGLFVGTGNIGATSVTVNALPLRIGASQGAEANPNANFSGVIDEVRVYNRPLSDVEVAALAIASAAVNGTCGTASDVAAVSAPTTNLCQAGTASSVTGTGPWSWTCNGSGGGTNASCAASVATVSGITQDINLLGVPITFTAAGSNLPPYMRFAVQGCAGDAVEVNKDTATTSHRDFRCIATEPASFPNAFTINLRGSTVNIAPTQSFAPLPLPAACAVDSDAFARLLTQYGNRGSGASRYGEIAFRPLIWSDLVTITTTLNSYGVCHESLPEDIRLELMSGLANWNAKKAAALADLSTMVGREQAKFTVKIMADAASIGLDFIGVGEAISTVKRLKKVSPGRVWRSIKKWGSAAGITARLGAKIAAYSTLSDLAALGSDGLSLAFDGLYVSDTGMTAEQRADVVNDLVALAVDGIAFSDPLEKFLKGITPFNTELKKELIKFSIVASTRLATDAAVQGIDANAYVALSMEFGSSATSFLPIVGGVFDAWKDIGDARAAVDTAFATVEKALGKRGFNRFARV